MIIEKKIKNNKKIIIKAGKSYKLKNEIWKIVHLFHQHNKITKNFYNDLIKSLMGVNIKNNNLVIIAESKTIHF